MADHDPDRCLCLYGSGAQLLDCFELAREAGVAVFDTVNLAAAPTAPHAEAAREARLLGIDWHEDVQAMLAATPGSLLAPLGPEASVPRAAARGMLPAAGRGVAAFFPAFGPQRRQWRLPAGPGPGPASAGHGP